VGEAGDSSSGVCEVVRVVGVDQAGKLAVKKLSKRECIAAVWIGE
jgi:hypothetical protein